MTEPRALTFDRWIVRGMIETLSPLRIGTGQTEASSDPNAPGELLMALDHHGEPVITASSLKGVVRSRLAEYQLSDTNQRLLHELLGRETREIVLADGSIAQAPLGGRAEFADCRIATCAATEVAKRLARQTAIDRATRTARDGSLRQAWTVNRGAKFHVEIVLDRCGRDHVALLLAGLDLLDGDFGSNIGGGRGVGRGRCRWSPSEIRHLEPKDVVAWMASGSAAKWTDFGQIEDGITPAILITRPDCAESGSIDVRVTFAFDGPMLVGTGEREKSGQAERLKPLRDPITGQHTISGSSLRGALRSHAERIYATVHGNARTSDDLATPIEWLFGTTRFAGAFLPLGEPERIASTTDRNQRPIDGHEQEMLAIDRFTGGGADGAKFQFNPAIDPVFTWRVRIDLRPVRGPHGAAAMGLLALLFRDLVEGDVTAGYGANKGYGSIVICKARIEQASWPALQQILGAKLEQPRAWDPADDNFKALVREAVAAFRSPISNETATEVV